MVEPFTEIMGIEPTKIVHVFQNVKNRGCFTKHWEIATPLTKLKFLEILEVIPLESAGAVNQLILTSELPLSQVIKKIEMELPFIKNRFVL